MEQDDGVRVEMPTYRVQGSAADVYGRLRLGLTDFTRVSTYVGLIQQFAEDLQNNAALITALYESALVTYVRGFHSCRAAGLMSERTIFDALGPSALAVHRYYVDIRNQHIAHNDSGHESSVVGVMVRPGDEGLTDLGVASLDLRRMFDEPSSISQLASLAGLLADRLASLEAEKADLVRRAAQAIGAERLPDGGPLEWSVPEPTVSTAPPREN